MKICKLKHLILEKKIWIAMYKYAVLHVQIWVGGGWEKTGQACTKIEAELISPSFLKKEAGITTILPTI